MKVYLIRNGKGEYHSGGCGFYVDKNPRVYVTIGAARAMLTKLSKPYFGEDDLAEEQKGMKIITFSLVEE